MVVKHRVAGIPCCNQGEGPGDESCSPMSQVEEKIFLILSKNRNPLLAWHVIAVIAVISGLMHDVKESINTMDLTASNNSFQ